MALMMGPVAPEITAPRECAEGAEKKKRTDNEIEV